MAPVAGLPTVTADDGRTTITVPATAPPTELVVQPLIEGNGRRRQAGQTITVHYTGVLWATGRSSTRRGTDALAHATSRSAPARVIPGWDKGLVGQKVGSQILLVVPPAEGYGAKGAGRRRHRPAPTPSCSWSTSSTPS